MPIDTLPAQNVTAQTPLLGYAPATTNQTGITTLVDLTGLSVTVTVPAGRTLRISGAGAFQLSVANSFMDLQISEDGTTVQYSDKQVVVANSNQYIPIEVIRTPAAGTHTYKLRASAGSGTMQMTASTTQPAFIMVEDITGSQLPVLPQSVPVGLLAQYGGSSSAVTTSGTNFVYTDLGVSLTVAVPAGRSLRICAWVRIQAGNATDVYGLAVQMDGANIGDRISQTFPGGSWGQTWINIDLLYSPPAGQHTFRLAFTRETGTGTATNQGVSQFYIEDITSTPAPAAGSPSAQLGSAQVTTNQSGITTETDLTGLTVTVTVPAGRMLRLSARANIQSTVADDRFSLRIKEGATLLNTVDEVLRVAAQDVTFAGDTIITPTAGTHVYKLTLLRLNGTGSGTLTCGATFPAFLLVEDITGVSISTPAASPSAIMLAQAQVTTIQTIGATATETDVAGLAVTVTVPAGRTLKITGHSGFQAGAAGDRIVGYIKEGSTYLGRYGQEDAQQAGGYMIFDGVTVISPSAGTHTYKLTAQRYGGTGSLATDNASDRPGAIYVEDVTGQPWPTASTSVPVGLLGQARVTANSAAATNLNNYMSVNVTVPDGRTLRVKFETYLQNSQVNVAAGGRVGLYQDNAAATGIGQTGQIQQSDLRLTAANVPEKFTCEAIVSPTAGSHTFSATLDNGGGGNITLIAGAGYPTILQVEDITPTPAAANTAPSSTLAYLGNLSQPSTTGVVASTLTSTISVAAGRTLRLSAKAHMTSTVAGDRVVLQLKDETGTVLNAAYLHMTAANNGDDLFVSTIVTPSSGSHTYTVWYGRDAGTGTVGVYNTAGTDTNYFLIEDISPQSVSPVLTANGVTPANSTARPSSPWVGMTIFETDTGKMSVWDGTAWRPIIPGDSGWINVTLTNGWVVYDNLYGPNGYSGLATAPLLRKVAGIVYLRGLVRSGTLGTSMMTLPAGYRPGLKALFTTMGDNNVLNRVDVQTDGQVINAAGASNAWCSLNGITFIADN